MCDGLIVGKNRSARVASAELRSGFADSRALVNGGCRRVDLQHAIIDGPRLAVLVRVTPRCGARAMTLNSIPRCSASAMLGRVEKLLPLGDPAGFRQRDGSSELKARNTLPLMEPQIDRKSLLRLRQPSLLWMVRRRELLGYGQSGWSKLSV